MSNQKISVVTGPCGGIGTQITAQLIRDGFHVVGLDINDSQLSDMSRKYQSQFTQIKVDLTSSSI
jgi:NADP-dependent 3-hydroxy acid dehydrogenase YdfG